MRRLREFMSIRRIRNKFLYITLAIGLIPLVVVGSISFVIATRNVRNSSMELYANNLSISNITVDLLSKNIESLARSVLGNGLIEHCMGEFSTNSDRYLSAQSIQRLDTTIAELISDNSYISSLFLFNEEGFRYQYNAFSRSSANLWQLDIEDIRKQDWYRQTMEADGKECYFLCDVLEDYAVPGMIRCVSVTKLLRDPRTGRAYGLLVMNTPIDYYRNVYPVVIRSEDFCYLLTDPKSGQTGYIGMQIGECSGIDEVLADYPRSLEAKGYTISRVRNQRTGWDLIHIIEDRKIIVQGLTIPLLTTCVILVLIVLSVICSVLSANTITRPLKKLNTLIDNADDPEQIAAIRFSDDEIGRIGSKFQIVMQQNQLLNQKVVKLSLLEKEAELNALQAQINPHFFYNTLASMYWLAKFGKTDDVAEMAVALSDIFKIALKRGTDMITVEVELEHIRKYISIQNMRYQNRIQFDLQVPEELLSRKLLKLLLQPLVENAIYHGLETKTGEWKLAVRGCIEGENLVFYVEDNGVGMIDTGAAVQGIGIRNVTERIRLRYGTAYGCQFESEPGKGTRVIVTVPDIGE